MNREPTVFIVDDDPAIRKSLRWLIESVGLKVQAHESAQDFLEVCNADTHGCLLLDIRMPRMSGLELQAKLREMNLQIPVIIVSGYGNVPMAVRSMKQGAVDFLEKPVADEILLEHIHRALAQDAKNRERRIEQLAVASRLESLTKREVEVLRLLIRGLSCKEIAQELHIGPKTAESHRTKVLRKMEAKSIPHLIHMGLLVPSLSEDARDKP